MTHTLINDQPKEHENFSIAQMKRYSYTLQCFIAHMSFVSESTSQ